MNTNTLTQLVSKQELNKVEQNLKEMITHSKDLREEMLDQRAQYYSETQNRKRRQ